jgi:rubrerythrin
MGVLPPRVEKLLLLFQQAIEAERAAQARYARAIELCDDDLLRGVLAQLRDDEARHERELVARYSQIRKGLGGPPAETGGRKETPP